jgi:hypothetical protein
MLVVVSRIFALREGAVLQCSVCQQSGAKKQKELARRGK